MKYVLGNMLGGGFVGGLDPDAKGYIDAVVAAGGTVSGGQKSAINTFYKTGKSAGWYSSLKRMYLPIWASAAPNAIDMIALGSGTFNGTVTHGAGFVQGDGLTGYFNSNIGLPAVGGSNGNGSMWQIIPQRAIGINRYEGINGPLLERVSIGSSVANFNQFILPSNNSSLTIAPSETSAGILIGSTTSTSSRFVKFLKSGVFTTQANTTTDTSTIPSGNLFFLARNNNDLGISNAHTERRGGYGFGLGLTESQAEAFTLALKNLWEGCTGSVLP
jgi:hypothetical protein